MNFKTSVCTAAVAMALAGHAWAAVSADEAAKLKTTLTPMGAERAGNKDGSIPPWEGGFTKVPASYKSGDIRPDFFAGEKPVLSINAKNMDQYADKLTEGVKGLMKKYPSYRIDVYPTHRSAAAPQWVYDNTFKNATKAKLTGDGFSLEGAYGGVPFPIPKDGKEALWNHKMAWNQGESSSRGSRCFVVTAEGKVVLASDGVQEDQKPYYYKDGNAESYKGYFNLVRYVQTAPSSKAGESILAHEASDGQPRGIWQYLVGQRRVRRAPAVAYDTPDSVTSGMGFFDEAFMLFGPWDHHEYKIVGKKEVYVPYNNNRADAASPDELVKPQFLNPDLVRWELHRVWEIEANLASGKRHVVPKRKYYLDEDSWQILLTDGWDAQGQLWRTGYTLTLLAPDVPALVGNVSWGLYSLQGGGYFINSATNGLNKQFTVYPRRPDSFFSPDELANLGAR
ncbi:DUF1329 domain-containing protein [Rhodoferax sp. GW822-FHT02A01]|uniref:DUF1329 domain-containing protein n=1 Tax=Rhodoferax sp. GW822-FHT02A01 TaxID=3141537 RepID=UPI00315D26E7